MALPDVARWSDLIIKLGDGEESETFAPSCLLRTEKGVSLSTAMSETTIVDCNDADAAAWLRRNGISLSMNVSGTGKLAMEEFDKWQAWAFSMAEKNLEVQFAVSAARNGGKFTGPFLLETFEVNATREDNGGLLMGTVAIASAGVVTWTAAAS